VNARMLLISLLSCDEKCNANADETDEKSSSALLAGSSSSFRRSLLR